MPIIMDGLNAVTSNAAICVSRQVFVKRSGKLKAKKPYPKIDFARPDAILHASVNYMWRILCFDLCDFAPHNCMPCTADWDLKACYHRSKSLGLPAWLDILDEAINQMESAIPAAEHHGALRWGRALDLLQRTD